MLVAHKALGLIPRTSRKMEDLEIEPGRVVHSCNLSTREAEALDLCELKASLVYIARPRPALNYTVRPCLKLALLPHHPPIKNVEIEDPGKVVQSCNLSITGSN